MAALRPIGAQSRITIPLFLAPAFASRVVSHISPQATFRTSTPAATQSPRTFTSSTIHKSKTGRSPIPVPPEVNLTVLTPKTTKSRASAILKASPDTIGNGLPYTVQISGPLGQLDMQLPAYMTLTPDATGRASKLDVLDAQNKKQREMWGTVRAYINNHILGVSEGHTAILRLVGVGYRATIGKTATRKQAAYEGQQFVVLKVGYSHIIELGVPLGVKASVPQPTRILLEGCDKEVVMQFAAEIRWWRRPEPYKGKGIFVNNETIKLKGKKAK